MRRLVGAVVALAAMLLLAPAAGAVFGQPAPPQPDPTEAPEQDPAAGDEDDAGSGETVAGTLRYDDEAGEDVFAEGVEVTVESADGSFSETAETDDEGRFEVAVSGPGAYSVSIDEETLPDDVVLRNADRTRLDVEVRGGQTLNVLYPLDFGEARTRDVSSFTDRFARLAVQGVRFGLIIAMAAIGLSLIFGTTGLVNFSHGEMVTFGALMAFLFNVTLGWDFYISAVLAVGLGVLAGSGVDRFFWRPLRNRGTGLIAMLVISIGLGIAIRYLYAIQFGGFSRAYRQFTLQRDSLDFGPISLVPRDLISMIIAIVSLVGVALFLQRTKMGKALRAVADNRDLAESTGIDVDRVITFVWAAGAGLAALGGILQGLSERVSWQMGWQLLLLMFASVTLGGLGTAYGALVGSLVVGMVMELSTLWIPSEFKTVTALAILIVILIFRPQGILGQAERVG
jgi:branched-chain amino acid transport system permease protein